MSIPKFLCIGAQKAGTTWLFYNLQSHKDIWMPPVKELHYFDHLFVSNNRSWTQWHICQGVKSAIQYHVNNAKNIDYSYLEYLTQMVSDDIFTEAWYRRAFSRPGARGKMTGDITPEYSTIRNIGIDYVRSFLGAVKIIYIIRDPVERAISQIKMLISRGKQVDDMDSWLSLADSWDLNNRGDYASYVPEWEKKFASEDIFFIPFKMIEREPGNLLMKIEKFLGVTHENFQNPNAPVHRGPSIDVPKEVVYFLQEKNKRQYDFIERFFGHDFITAI